MLAVDRLVRYALARRQQRQPNIVRDYFIYLLFQIDLRGGPNSIRTLVTQHIV
jgi:hypothetical protein